MARRVDRSKRKGDEGSVLVLALVYLSAVGVTMFALMGFLGNSLSDVSPFASGREEQLAASSVAQLAIQNIRYTPLLGSTQTLNASPPNYCWGTGPSSGIANIDGYSMNAWCSTIWNAGSAATRIVTISICSSALTAAGCAASPYLQVVITFDDYPPGGAQQVSGPCTYYSWCGQGQTIDSWEW